MEGLGFIQAEWGSYLGFYRNGKQDIFGIENLKNGASYHGEFKEGSYHGRGQYTDGVRVLYILRKMMTCTAGRFL
jgi:hypothetical protein